MKQPFLDLMDYTATYDGKTDYLTFLCNGKKTDGRFGFVPASRLSGGFVFSAITPYGLSMMEQNFICLIRDFGAFNYTILKELCESPLPDACVINLVDNAISYLLGDEPGEVRTHTMWPVAYIGHRPQEGKDYWTECGCDCYIDGKKYSLHVARLLETTNRLKVLQLKDKFTPREECMKEFTWHPHPAAVDSRGNSLWEKDLNTIAVIIAAKRLGGGH